MLPNLESVFRRLDEDTDGWLTQPQFVLLCNELGLSFTIIERNILLADGRVGLSELQVALRNQTKLTLSNEFADVVVAEGDAMAPTTATNEGGVQDVEDDVDDVDDVDDMDEGICREISLLLPSDITSRPFPDDVTSARRELLGRLEAVVAAAHRVMDASEADKVVGLARDAVATLMSSNDPVHHAALVVKDAVAVVRSAAIRRAVDARLSQVIAQARATVRPEDLHQFLAAAESQTRHVHDQLARLADSDLQRTALTALSRARREIAHHVDLAVVRAAVERRLHVLEDEAIRHVSEEQLRQIRELAHRGIEEACRKIGSLDRDEVMRLAEGAVSTAQARMTQVIATATRVRDEIQRGYRRNQPRLRQIQAVVASNADHLKSTIVALVQSEFAQAARDVHKVLGKNDANVSVAESASGVVAGLIAPLRLKWLHYWTRFHLAHSLCFLILTVICLAIDWDSTCELSASPVISLRTFFLVFAGVFAAKVASRIYFVAILGRFWTTHATDLVTTADVSSVPSGKRSGLEEMVDDLTELGEEAVVISHQLQTGFISRLAHALHTFFIAWRCFGIRLWFDSQCDLCRQTNLQWLLNLTVVEFLFFLTYHIAFVLVQLALLLLNFYEADRFIAAARTLDAQYLGFPLCEIAVDQFVVANSRHVQAAMKRRRDTYRVKLVHEKNELVAELDMLNRKIELMQEQVERFRMTAPRG